MSLKNKIAVTIAILGFCSISNAQVGIGTLNPEMSSQLDIVSANKGLLIPRLSLTETSNQSPVTGTITSSLLVYNTITANDVTPGFYYWQVNKWVRLLAKSDPIAFNETLTTLNYNTATNELTYKDENGVSNVLQLTVQTGPQGPQGVPGNDGSTGPQGPQGIPGNDGATGPQGPQGAPGNDGATGLTGPQGIPGNDGAIGATGPQGPQGVSGNDGATGLTGPQGIQGVPGNDGAIGAAGPQGPQGVPGNDGAIGAAGPQGPQGVPGNDGAIGAAGPQGPQGVPGNDGAIGATGPQGPQGVPGNDGAIGATGPQGPQGVPGNDGAIGATGPQGPQGVPGNDGAVGAQGGIGLIVNGTNTTVSGTGTTSDPYKVNTPSIPVTTVSNTSTANNINTTVNGTTGQNVTIINSNVLDAANGNLISTVNGVASTPAVPVLITANNALTVTNGNVQLGGALVTPTTITTDAVNTLTVAGLQAGAATDNIVITDTNGVLKTITPSELSANSWNILGNAGTDPAINFIGTTDDTNLIFKRNNIQSGKIDGTNVFLGYQTFPDATGGGIGNVAIGYGTLKTIESGTKNIAIGYDAGGDLTTGSNNILIGGGTIQRVNASSPDAYDELNIGNVLFGTNINQTADRADAKIGINVQAPTNTLHVSNRNDPTSDPVRFEGLKASSNPADLNVVVDATGVLKTAPPRGGFSAKVPLEIGATITAPTKPTTRENDFIRYKDLGNNEIEVDFLYSATDSSGSDPGDGDYLFSLPNGYQFDLTDQPLYSGPIIDNTTKNSASIYTVRNTKTAFAFDPSGMVTTSMLIIPYSATQFRIIFTSYGRNAIGTNGNFPLSNNNNVMAGRFTFVKQ
ncbi:collagen-like protein [Flavobacterium sp. ACN6]|uniref:collagen-like protein n=1 Tax=Flavobacterium sp. ACN6 TaxID=1920426 RepID=UPI000BB30854|nr:collagen-like protein [Flavobacterium sp. ACN6]PBJ12775.1 Collagen triple helix repeat (20 copies) [Flavobacterium sp. ACN6]